MCQIVESWTSKAILLELVLFLLLYFVLLVTEELFQKTVVKPPSRQDETLRLLKNAKYSSDQTLSNFGIALPGNFAVEMMKIPGRVLIPPRLKFQVCS